MQVVATAGHVDHGKSTLVWSLTGLEPDRWSEERRRGLSIGLGYAWTTLPGIGDVAFVDVPGHERFVSTMLAGVGPVPAVMFVVAADEGWMPQSAEHLAALDALDVRHGLLVVTRADLEDPELAMEEAALEFQGTSLESVPRLGVSAVSGQGIDELKAAIGELVRGLPAVDAQAPVRLWVDRAFSMRGAGTVVTGTLPAGTVRRGDSLTVAGTGTTVVVREVQSLGESVESMSGVARVALNLRGVGPDLVPRGSVLVTDGAWTTTRLADVSVQSLEPLAQQVVVHAGSSGVPARVRPLGDGFARLTLSSPLPLHIADRLLLRDPGSRRVVGATVLDPAPPELRRRGSARQRAADLEHHPGTPDGAAEVRRRRFVKVGDLRAMGADVPQRPLVGDWLVDDRLAHSLAHQLTTLVEDHARQQPLDSGVALEAARQRLDVPDRDIVRALVELTGGKVVVRSGRLVPAGDTSAAELEEAVAPLLAHLGENPFDAPDADSLARWGLGRKEVAAAERAGLVLKIADGVVLGADVLRRAVDELRTLPQPFTLSDARQHLGTSRRVVVPLLERLQREGYTRRVGDSHEVRGSA